MNRTKDTEELVKNTWDVRLLADRPPGEIPAARAQPLEGQLHLPFARSPESTKRLLQNHR
jgi:hypothetical protein